MKKNFLGKSLLGLLSLALLVPGMFAAEPALALTCSPACTGDTRCNTDWGTCFPTKASGVTCYDPQFICPANNQCYVPPASCSGGKVISTTSCGCVCRSGTTDCSGTCVPTTTGVCSGGQTWSVCANACVGTAYAVINPASVQTGKVNVSELCLSGSCVSAWSGVFGAAGTTNYLTKWTATGIGTSTVMENGGNVGIGIASTTDRLTVTGNTKLNGQLTLNNTAATSAAIIGSVFTGGDTAKSYINFNQISGSNDPGFVMHETSANVGDTNRGVIHIAPSDDNSNTDDYVAIHGTNDPETIRLYTGGNINTPGNVYANTVYSTTGYCLNGDCRTSWTDIVSAGGGALWAASGSDIANANAGDVGIGYATPTQKLDVNGSFRIAGSQYINNTSPTIYLQDTNGRAGMLHMNADKLYFLSADGINSTTWATNGSYWPLTINMTDDVSTFGGEVNFMEGNVGIGNSAPTAKLDVVGDEKLSGSLTVGPNQAVIKSTDTGNPYVDFAVGTGASGIAYGNGIILRRGKDNSSWGNIGMVSDTMLGIGARNAVGTSMNVLYINSDGNVGIGRTPSVNYKLQTQGYINSTGLCINGDCKTSWSATSPWVTNGTNIYNSNAGNVGIGTSAPTYPLDVRGTIRQVRDSNYDIWIQGGAYASGDDRNLALLGTDEDSGDMLYVNYGSEYASGTRIGGPVQVIGNQSVGGTMAVTGNVGIGAAPSTERLLVSGNSYVTGDSYMNGGEFIFSGPTEANYDYLKFHETSNTFSLHGDAPLDFSESSNQPSAGLNVASLNSTGSVGVGIMSPQMGLHVTSANGGFTLSRPGIGMNVIGNDPQIQLYGGRAYIDFANTSGEDSDFRIVSTGSLLQIGSSFGASGIAIASSGVVNMSSNLVVGGGLSVTDTANFNYNVTVGGTANLNYNVNVGATLSLTGAGSSTINTPNNGLLSIKLNGDTGLTLRQKTGYYGVYQTLDVNANINDSAVMTIQGANYYGPSTASVPLDILKIRAGDGSSYCVFRQLGGLTSWGAVHEYCTSDARLKKDIIDASDDALAYLHDFRVREFTWKETGGRDFGVIAQEVMVKHPELVGRDDVTGYYDVAEPNGWRLIKAIQELDDKFGDVVKLDASGNATIDGNIIAPNNLWGKGAGWVNCPEEGDCACPNGQFIGKTRNRGAAIYCVKL